MSLNVFRTGLALTMLISTIAATANEGPDWSKVPVATLPLFYPGQSTYEWLRSPDHKGAVKEVKRGDSCVSCHDEDDAEKDIGEKIVSGKRLEPKPVQGKSGMIPLQVQVAYDTKNVYFRLKWKTQGTGPRTAMPHYRFDGKKWILNGGTRLSSEVQQGKQPAAFEDRVSLMIGDETVPEFGNGTYGTTYCSD